MIAFSTQLTSVFLRCIAVAAFGSTALLSVAATPEWHQPKRDMHMIAVTDTTPAGANVRPPTLDRPVYYLVENAGYQVFGADGPKERPPQPDDLIRYMAGVLAKHGYRPMSDAHPPSLLLVWTWGTMNAEIMPSMMMGERQDREIPDAKSGDVAESGEYQTNWHRLARFLGGYKVGLLPKEAGGDEPRERLFHDTSTDLVRDLAKDDLYVVAILAYDFAAFQRKQKVLLWTTKMACPAAGLTMPDALPTLIAAGAPYVGRETPKPVAIWTGDRLKPEVKVGDPKVVPDEPVPDPARDPALRSSSTAK